MASGFLHFLAFPASFAAMELIAWSNHKYIMHGWGWFLHRSHHLQRKGWLEWNDMYFLFYALGSIVLCYYGWEKLDYRFWMGAGIAAYGLTYFLIHDILIHNRLRVFRKTRWRYFEAMKRAHKMHHKHTGRENGEEFGMLLFSRKYFKILDAKNLLNRNFHDQVS